MSKDWLVVGVSGVTCGGKTSLVKALKEHFPESVIVAQDDYFRDPDAPEQVIIPEFNHPNYELMTSLDMAKMREDVKNILKEQPKTQRPAVLILDGFALYRDHWLTDVCDLRFFLVLSREECYNRRIQRVYEPPDPPGYFEKIVWPEYEKIAAEAFAISELIKLDGTKSQKDTATLVLAIIQRELKSRLNPSKATSSKLVQ